MILEVLVFLVIFLFIIGWALWFIISKKKLAKKYKPENDKSRKGGIAYDGGLKKPEPSVNVEIENNGGLDESERRELFSTTDVSDARENINSSRGNSKSIGKFLRRKRK